MPSVKKTTTKKKPSERLSGPFKDSMVELLCREALAASPDLTRTQLQRIFSHCYQAVRADKKGKMVENARKVAKAKFAWKQSERETGHNESC